MPLSAFISTPKIWSVLETNPFIHSSTFGGNPLACAAGIAAINVTLEEDLPGQAARKGKYMLAQLIRLKMRYDRLIHRTRRQGPASRHRVRQHGDRLQGRRGPLPARRPRGRDPDQLQGRPHRARAEHLRTSSSRTSSAPSRRRSRKSTTPLPTSRGTRSRRWRKFPPHPNPLSRTERGNHLRIAVLGAAGAMAQVVLRDLLEFVPDVEITAADRQPGRAIRTRAFAPATLDARDEAATARLLEGHDAVLNCVTYYFNVPIMRAALAARVPYSDLGGLYHGSLKQFALHEDFVRAGVPALLGMGSTPGHHERHGRRAVPRSRRGRRGPRPRRLHRPRRLRARCPSRMPSTPSSTSSRSSPWSSATAAPRPCRPMSGRETIEFPPPVGRVEALYTLHSEVAMFPRSFPGAARGELQGRLRAGLHREGALPRRARLRLAREDRGKLSPRERLLELAARQAVPGRRARRLRRPARGPVAAERTAGRSSAAPR